VSEKAGLKNISFYFPLKWHERILLSLSQKLQMLHNAVSFYTCNLLYKLLLFYLRLKCLYSQTDEDSGLLDWYAE